MGKHTPMTKQMDKKRNTSTIAAGTTGTSAERTKANTRPAKPGEEHTYDPVGMAGKKAGKVVQLEEQARKEGSTNKKGGAKK
ncbi:MAG: hypothetical protein IPN62_05035 [Flavobacteriales bacterium]|nr:hypothetical protein [Flavobacteriales bacterium]